MWVTGSFRACQFFQFAVSDPDTKDGLGLPFRHEVDVLPVPRPVNRWGNSIETIVRHRTINDAIHHGNSTSRASISWVPMSRSSRGDWSGVSADHAPGDPTRRTYFNPTSRSTLRSLIRTR